MTPLVREMAAIVPEPETAHWFDLGTISGRIEAQRVYWDDIRHMPYPRTRLSCWAALRGTKMEPDCILGLRHDWQPTGRGYFLWTENTTSVPRPPENAPYYREERCWRCNQKRHVNHLPPNAQHHRPASAGPG